MFTDAKCKMMEETSDALQKPCKERDEVTIVYYKNTGNSNLESKMHIISIILYIDQYVYIARKIVKIF